MSIRNGIVLFTSDRGITPAELAKAAEERGFDTLYVPEHTHIPVRRDAAHPTGGDDDVPEVEVRRQQNDRDAHDGTQHGGECDGPVHWPVME